MIAAPSPVSLRAYRITSTFVGVAMVSFGLFYRLSDPHLRDPLEVRLALAAVAFGGSGLSYASGTLRRHYRSFVYALFAAAIALVVWLCVVNRFAAPHAAAAMLAVSAFGLAGSTHRSERTLGLCIGGLVAALLLALALVPRPAVSPGGYGVALVATGATAYLIVRTRVRAHLLLAEREARYRSVVEHASEGIFLFDAGTRRVMEANAAFYRMLGYGPEEVPGLQVDELVVVGPGEPTVESNVEHARQVRRFSLGIRTYRRKDGSTIDVDVSGSVIDVDGRDVCSVTLHDATERRRVEHELRSAKEHADEARSDAERTLASAEEARSRAEELLHLKSTFLANMSHEIRTPLTAIIGFAEVLAEEVPVAQREYVSIIDGAARRLYDTLNSVLDLAQLEGGAVALRPEPLDLAAEARAAAEAFRALAQRKGLSLRVDVPPAPVGVFADRGALARVLNNLLGNALKFTEGGTVTVSVAPGGAGGAQITVRDTGIGIDPAFLPHVFDEFRQASQGYDRSHEGNGLGLAITKRLVSLMGGALTVESVVGVGSTFVVRLPAPPAGGDGVPTAPAVPLALVAEEIGNRK